MSESAPLSGDDLRRLFERADALDPLCWIGPPLDPNLLARRCQSIERAKRELGMDGETRRSRARLDAELQRRLWALFDAAKTLCDGESAEKWAKLYTAVGAVPESQRPKDAHG